MIQAGYVRLFLPYDASGDDDLLRDVRQGASPLREDRPRILPRGAESPDREVVEGALDCMGRLWRVRVDGMEVPDPEFSFARRDPNGQPGLLTYLPIDSLPAGRHVIEVDALISLDGVGEGDGDGGLIAPGEPSSAPDAEARPAAEAQGTWRTYYIPFWK